MLIQVLKSKLKEVIVTAADTEYEGSITIDEDLMMGADLNSHERVEVNSVNGESRIVTYVIPGEIGSGCIELNGGAANFFKKGDKIHVNCFAILNEEDIPIARPPKIVITDEFNKITEIID